MRVFSRANDCIAAFQGDIRIICEFINWQESVKDFISPGDSFSEECLMAFNAITSHDLPFMPPLHNKGKVGQRKQAMIFTF